MAPCSTRSYARSRQIGAEGRQGGVPRRQVRHRPRRHRQGLVRHRQARRELWRRARRGPTREAVRSELKAGKVEYRADKFGIAHVGIGKVSFDTAKLVENYGAVLDEVLRAKPSDRS